MIATVNTNVAVPAYFTNALGAGATGLAVTGTARLAGSATTTAVVVTERGAGFYDLAFTPSAAGQWFVIASTTIAGNAAAWTETVTVVTAAQFDPAASIAAAGVAVVSPVDPVTLRLTLYRGDDAPCAWTVTSPDLTGATGTLTIRTFAGVAALTKTVSIVGTAVSVTLTAAETAALALGTSRYTYETTFVLGSGATRTLIAGEVWTLD